MMSFVNQYRRRSIFDKIRCLFSFHQLKSFLIIEIPHNHGILSIELVECSCCKNRFFRCKDSVYLMLKVSSESALKSLAKVLDQWCTKTLTFTDVKRSLMKLHIDYFGVE